MGKILRFIKETIGYGIYGLIPYVDLDLFGFLYGTLNIGFFGKLPFVEPIDARQLSWFKRILLTVYILVPYIDLDWVKFFRLHQIPGIKKVLAFSQAKKGSAASTVAKNTSKKTRKYAKTAGHHGKKHARREAEDRGEEYMEEARGRPQQQGRAMTDGGQPQGGSGEDSSSGISNSLNMGFLGGGSDSFTMRFRSSASINSEHEKGDEIEAEYNEEEGSLEAVDGELEEGTWELPDHDRQMVSVEKVHGEFEPSPGSEYAVEEAAGLEDDGDDSGGMIGGSSGGNGSGGNGDGGDSGRLMTDGGSPGGGGGSGIQMNEGTMKAAGALVAVLGIVAFLWFSGWGQQASEQAGLASVGLDFDSQMRQVQGVFKRLQCMGSAACFRQWQMNNTEQPGSEDVGERYALQIDNFNVNDGYTLDVNRRTANTTVPVGFSVYNPRNGLKGITAHDVEYRVSILGPDNDQGDPICQTEGWNDLGGQFSDGNAILPGGFATPSQTLENLNIGNCGLLQPALGIDRKVELQVKYDYSSQATLYVDAMSWENLQSLGERPSTKESETADTPVQSYVNAESPIVYRQEGNQRTSDHFEVQLGFTTEQNNLKYRIDPDSIKFYDSTETERVGGSRCQLSEDGGNDQFTVTEATSDYLNRRVDPEDPSSWFDSVTGPSPIRCTMQLSDPQGISPTGETLTMRVEGNYTVMFEESFTEFEITNTACENLGTYNCPLLITKEEKQNNAEYSEVYSRCDSDIRIDAQNGCDIRKFDGNWEVITGPINAKGVDGDIEEGEVALTWSTFISDWAEQREIDVSSWFGINDGESVVATTTFNAVDNDLSIAEDPITDPDWEDANCGDGNERCPEKSRFGLPIDEKENFLNLENRYPYLAITRDGEGNADIVINEVDADKMICEDSTGNVEKAVYQYLTDHASSRDADFQHVLWGQITTGDCSSGALEQVYDTLNPFNEGYEERKGNCDTFMYVDGGDGSCFVS